MTSSPPATSAPGDVGRSPSSRLAVPPGWVVAPLTVLRLERQLARAPASVGGVVAELVPLVAGSSYRTQAEWAALRPLTDVMATEDRVARGAVLVRTGIETTVRDDSIEVEGATLLTDRGAVAHDGVPDNTVADEADPHGRPPFPWRPVVLFLGREPVAPPAWVSTMVDQLIELEVEARLAVGEWRNGPSLTRPCLPTAASVQALQPDVVVALDAAACAVASTWLGDDRSATVIEVSAHLADQAELVSWQLGLAEGRLRARVGRDVTAPTMRNLVIRLTAGPHPLPPQNLDVALPGIGLDAEREEGDDSSKVDALGGLARERPRPSVFVAHGANADEQRVRALVDQLRAHGCVAASGSIERRGPAPADLLVLHGATHLDRSHQAVIAGRMTIIDLTNDELDVDLDDPGEVRITEVAARLLEVCGAATTADPRAARAARRDGARALVLPTLLDREAIDSAADQRLAQAVISRFLGWACYEASS